MLYMYIDFVYSARDGQGSQARSILSEQGRRRCLCRCNTEGRWGTIVECTEPRKKTGLYHDSNREEGEFFYFKINLSVPSNLKIKQIAADAVQSASILHSGHVVCNTKQ